MNKAFLKWAGGKGQLVDKILSLMPLNKPVGRYIEPFVGSGIVALNVPDIFEKIIIGDTNEAVIGLWKEIQEDGIEFANHGKLFFSGRDNNEQSYYTYRGFFNNPNAKWKQWHYKLFLYLNRHGFNGLCRFNSKGEFNVPFGRYKTVYYPEKELRRAAEVTKKMEIHCQSFFSTMSLAKEGDVIYCDPPYVPISKTSNFTAYSAGGFTFKDHEQLAIDARVAKDDGATVIISNNDTPLARKLYKETRASEIHLVDVRKSIGASAATRKKQGEIIAVYRPEKTC